MPNGIVGGVAKGQLRAAALLSHQPVSCPSCSSPGSAPSPPHHGVETRPGRAELGPPGHPPTVLLPMPKPHKLPAELLLHTRSWLQEGLGLCCADPRPPPALPCWGSALVPAVFLSQKPPPRGTEPWVQPLGASRPPAASRQRGGDVPRGDTRPGAGQVPAAERGLNRQLVPL